jgi:hypothetical protein
MHLVAEGLRENSREGSSTEFGLIMFIYILYCVKHLNSIFIIRLYNE